MYDPAVPKQTDVDFVRQCMNAYPAEADWLIAVLEDIQAGLGFIPVQAVGLLARYFGLQAPDVRALIEDSEAFRSTPPARHLLHVCTGPICTAAGARKLLAEAKGKPDHLAGYCLGCCDKAPVVMLDGVIQHRIRPGDVSRMLQQLSDGDDG